MKTRTHMTIEEKLLRRISELESFKILANGLRDRPENVNRVNVSFELEPMKRLPDEYRNELGNITTVVNPDKLHSEREIATRERLEKRLRGKEFVSSPDGECYYDE